ncbi:hypothetical protein GGX14DRAFT_383901 [Mycena pura]|uniref:Uncharacterized protein n=1 Tax=Mycena pura TaxID=153505 RepID=A0AAD7E614_9AGAR|nr:hypothetical protein GGX14DRAFT_383901 [Mycena pura]
MVISHGGQVTDDPSFTCPLCNARTSLRCSRGQRAGEYFIRCEDPAHPPYWWWFGKGVKPRPACAVHVSPGPSARISLSPSAGPSARISPGPSARVSPALPSQAPCAYPHCCLLKVSGDCSNSMCATHCRTMGGCQRRGHEQMSSLPMLHSAFLQFLNTHYHSTSIPARNACLADELARRERERTAHLPVIPSPSPTPPPSWPLVDDTEDEGLWANWSPPTLKPRPTLSMAPRKHAASPDVVIVQSYARRKRAPSPEVVVNTLKRLRAPSSEVVIKKHPGLLPTVHDTPKPKRARLRINIPTTSFRTARVMQERFRVAKFFLPAADSTVLGAASASFRAHEDHTKRTPQQGSLDHDLDSGAFNYRWETWKEFEAWRIDEETTKCIELRRW